MFTWKLKEGYWMQWHALGKLARLACKGVKLVAADVSRAKVLSLEFSRYFDKNLDPHMSKFSTF